MNDTDKMLLRIAIGAIIILVICILLVILGSALGANA